MEADGVFDFCGVDMILIDEATVKLALEALELAQDNLRDHGDNCFLHDEGEYNRCFCGKDSLSNHLQSVVEKLDEALADQPAQQEPVAVHQFRNRYVTDWYDGAPDHQDGHGPYEVRTLYTAPPKEKNT